MLFVWSRFCLLGDDRTRQRVVKLDERYLYCALERRRLKLVVYGQDKNECKYACIKMHQFSFLASQILMITATL